MGGMLRVAAVTAAAFLGATIVLAVGAIPTMYTGSFPSTTHVFNITGTFKGSSLVLKGVQRRTGKQLTGLYSCARASSTQTTCTGTLRSDDGRYSDNHTVTITWGGGQPIAMTGSH